MIKINDRSTIAPVCLLIIGKLPVVGLERKTLGETRGDANKKLIKEFIGFRRVSASDSLEGM